MYVTELIIKTDSKPDLKKLPTGWTVTQSRTEEYEELTDSRGGKHLISVPNVEPVEQ